MGMRSRELLCLLLALCALALSEPVNKTKKIDQYNDYDGDDNHEEVLFNENKPCPRDCICSVSQGYKKAKCNRLEVGTQQFGDDITDLIIENADPKFPIDLDDFIFRNLGLHQIATVTIANSTIGSVGPKAFHGLHELYAVNLSNSSLKSLHPETFATNKKLLLMTLSKNPLKFPRNSNEYFLNSSSIQELDISYCNANHITPSTFKNMPGLMYLNLAGNNLDDLDPDTFKKLLDLEELDLSDNLLKSLPDDIFSENTELATLHIQRNPIHSVFDLTISDLLTLNAGQTNIQFVGPSMFNGMVYIANLNLSGNGIKKIHPQAFHKLVELNYLDLSYNNLDLMSESLIKENIDLDIFKISNNPNLKHLPTNGFECSAEQFNIYLFDASNCGLEEITDNALSTFTALTQINLSGNQIKEISPKVFAKSPRLVDINLAYNFLTTLHPKMFEQNKDLGKLNLQGNPLKEFSIEVFSHSPLLTYLDMSHTELTSLWKNEKAIKEASNDKEKNSAVLSHLSYLNVSHCRITIIKKSELESSQKLLTLDISNNPLACSNEFEDLMSWLSTHKVSLNGNSAIIANLVKDAKSEDVAEVPSWESLALKVCGKSLPVPHPIEPLASVSEEIWERIDADAQGNFDLKDTLDDVKPDEKVLKPVDNQIDNDANDSDDDQDLDGDDEDDGDDDGDDDDDADDDDEADDDAAEEYDDAPTVHVNLFDGTKKAVNVETTAAPLNEKEKVSIAVKLLENDVYAIKDEEDDDDVIMEASLSEDDHDRFAYLWPILIAMFGVLLLLLAIGKIVMWVCSRKTQQPRYHSAIIAAMNAAPGRTKKDCGLVYQQLSEELGTATPKLPRYEPLHSITVKASNMYESSPFHHKNIVPEAV